MRQLYPTADQDHQQGDGVELEVVEARGAERDGIIRILVMSVLAAVVVLGLIWLVSYGFGAHSAHI